MAASKHRIMLVEDEFIVALDVRQRLEALGYQVAGETGCAEEALTLAERDRPDLVLMDIRLHGRLDGIDAAAIIKEKYHIPVIFLTAFSNEATLQRAREIEAYGYLIKPFQDHELQAAIEIALYKSKMEEKLRLSEERYRSLVELLPQSLLLLDLGGVVEFANPQAAELFGLAGPQALVGKSVIELLYSTSYGSAQELPALLIKTGRLIGLDIFLRLPDGSYLPGEANLALVKDAAGHPASILVSAQDVQQRKEGEKSLLRSSEQARLLIQAGGRLNQTLDLDTVYATVCDEARQVLFAPAAAVSILEPGSQLLRPVFISGLPPAALDDFPVLPLTSFLANYPKQEDLVILPDYRLRPAEQFDLLKSKWGLGTGIGVQLFFEGRLVGLLIVFSVAEADAYLHEQLGFLQAYALQAAAAITNARLFEQVYVGRQRLQELSMKLLRVQENERRYLAQELHDQVGQLLTGLQFTLESGKHLPPERMRERMAEAQELIAALIAQVRDLSLSLRPNMLDEMGLLPALLWHFRHFEEQTGIRVDFTSAGLDQRYSPEVETAVYRIAQEALTNIARYAGVSRAVARLSASDGVLCLEIEDQGCGFDLAEVLHKETSLGLAGMRERALLLGGELTIRSAPSQGARLEAVLPVNGAPLERRKDDYYRSSLAKLD